MPWGPLGADGRGWDPCTQTSDLRVGGSSPSGRATQNRQGMGFPCTGPVAFRLRYLNSCGQVVAKLGKQVVERRCRLRLHAGEQVSVAVHREGRTRVAEAPADGVQILARLYPHRGRRVSQRVRADLVWAINLRTPGDPLERPPEVVRLPRPTIGPDGERASPRPPAAYGPVADGGRTGGGDLIQSGLCGDDQRFALDTEFADAVRASTFARRAHDELNVAGEAEGRR